MSERRAVVTGASRGIGEHTARRLARDGWALLLVARREDRLQALAGELGGDVHWLAADLTDEDAPARVRAKVNELWGGLDLLVNNAGSSWHTTFADGGYESVRQTMDLNFYAVVRLSEKFPGEKIATVDREHFTLLRRFRRERLPLLLPK